MQLQKNVSLRSYNTFGIDAAAEYMAEVSDLNDIFFITENNSLPARKHILGGGSNVLMSGDIKGLVLLNRLKGIEQIKEDDEHVWLNVAAGEVWHELVLYAIAHNLSGIENLSLIPGTVGASPMQNIGAYGVEVKDTIESVTGWHWNEKTFISYNNAACRFGYRDSIFKHELKGSIFITSVVYKLNKQPKYNISYGAIEQELQKMNIAELSIKAISDAVIAIRQSKLPDPKQIGNAGSFFKNPTIPKAQYSELQTQHEGIPSYPVNDTHVKLPAGWLIEQCGWKGYRNGDTGVHAKQALVLVNYGNAKGSDIWQLSEEILSSVKSKFGIPLEREVQMW